jgi:hypothetical protein
MKGDILEILNVLGNKNMLNIYPHPALVGEYFAGDCWLGD